MYPLLVQRLAASLVVLPGVGKRSSLRYAREIALWSSQQRQELLLQLQAMESGLVSCPECHGLMEQQRCPLCHSIQRDPRILCVVEGYADMVAIEEAGCYRGHYHILGGAVSPMENRRWEDLHGADVAEHVHRLRADRLVVATSNTPEGNITARMVQDAVIQSRSDLPIYFLGQQLLSGVRVENLSGEMLKLAFENVEIEHERKSKEIVSL